MPHNILVTGATGSVGREVVNLIRTAGVPVRAMSRHPQFRSLPADVEGVAADFSSEPSLRAALTNVDQVFWMIPTGPGAMALLPPDAFVALAKEAGVQHVVLLSALAVEYPQNALGALHARAEHALATQGLPATVLRPGGFMTNALAWAEAIRSATVLSLPFADTPAPLIDPRDVAAIAARALLDRAPEGAVLRLTGPEALSPREQTRILAHALGKPIEVRSVPESTARLHMLKTMPAPLVDAIVDLNRRGAGPVLPTVADMLGRPARSFADWTRDHADLFR
jgi:uncharacterized protein YbjT (DUF2867 family)